MWLILAFVSATFLGFYDTSNKKKKKINDIVNYKEYLNDYCAHECPYFLIKKEIGVEKK